MTVYYIHSISTLTGIPPSLTTVSSSSHFVLASFSSPVTCDLTSNLNTSLSTFVSSALSPAVAPLSGVSEESESTEQLILSPPVRALDSCQRKDDREPKTSRLTALCRPELESLSTCVSNPPMLLVRRSVLFRKGRKAASRGAASTAPCFQ